MSNSIKLSIIVPCYKVEAYLPRCLDSLVNQTLDDIEIICINDGSPDNCINILNDYYDKYGDKIVIIDKQNEGVWRGRMDGIKVAKGEYIGFVDSDDYVALDFAEKLYSAAIKENADIAVCGFNRVSLDTGKVLSKEMNKAKHKLFDVKENPGLLLEVNSSVWNKIYRGCLLKEMSDLPNPPIVLEDVLFLELVYIRCNTITFIPDLLVNYMVRTGSAMNSVSIELLPQIYESMCYVRELYVVNNVDMVEYIDANAFLHLGISFIYRLSENKEIDIGAMINKNKNFLNSSFPKWNNNKYISLRYVNNNKGSNLKLYIVKKFYDAHLFELFLLIYKFMINNIGVDIKW